ncbi:MAG: zeta toxin family protein [Planctomycetes bacterium]|uniref:zeta toxin family protein n=1 Tax=Candidatus Wunengus sp. YC65 TaxID=3367701 RepID=UPI001D1FD9DA|nr:zeta toxin family protein [Planctomycetota bacterium]
MVKEKKIVIIAGPNGAGKTTFAKEFLPNEAGCPIFVNADLIAAGLSPFFPEHAAFRAGRLMLEQIKMHLLHGNNFAFETTLSGKIYAHMIPEWQRMGYKVKLIFLSLPDVSIAIERVKERVLQGGHNVPEEIIRRRFEKGWLNFQHIYKQLVDAWILYDNSGRTPELLEEGEKR